MVANLSDEEQTIPKATVLGIAEETTEALVDKINPKVEPRLCPSEIQQRQARNKELYQKLLQGKLDHLSTEDRQEIEPVLLKYAHVFHDDESNDFKGTDLVEHEIHVGNARPIKRPPYKVPYALRDEMKRQVDDMLKRGIIRESKSPWSAPAILVKKKSLNGNQSYRFCIDFRGLNSVTKMDSYPLPQITETTANLYGSKYFSVLDLYSGFHQLSIKEEHKELTGFSVPHGKFECNRMSFGLCGAPSSFQRLMDVALRDMVGTELYVYMDDVILHARTAQEHAQRLEKVLQRFDAANLQLNPGKCVLAQSQVQYLGFVLSERGVAASPEKVTAVRNYPVPKTVKDVRAFVGLGSFYRRLVPKFAEIAKPLTELTRKDRPFEWGPRQQKAFDDLKDRLCTTPVLAYPNFDLPFILTTDASSVAVAAILSQVQDGEERPIAYGSRQLSTTEQAYSASEAEMLALVFGTKHFRCFIYGKRFLVRTDHSALTYLRTFSDTNCRLMRWSLRLSELDFDVQHRPGTKIPHADALSRHVGIVMDDGIPDKAAILREQSQDAFCNSRTPGKYASRSEYFLDEDGVLYRRQPDHKHQLVVPGSLVQDIIKANHSPVYVAHPGVKRTFNLVSISYWWPGMRNSIADFVRKCDSCQRRKEDREFVAPLGEVEQPTGPFQVTSMDLTGPYCMTPRKNKYLLTFVDHFSKWVEAFPVPDQSAETCARVYATQIITRHGSGSTLVTDRGSAFMSSFFKETCKILGIRRIHTSSYHAASNGMNERWHRSLHAGLSHYIDASNTNWDQIVPFFLMAYRATPNTTTTYSPYYLLRGREMQLPSSDNLKAKVPNKKEDPDHRRRLESLKSSLRQAYQSVRKANRQSHLNNKRLYDRKAKLRIFEIRDIVYLYNPAVKVGQCRKFRKVWSGPFQITAKISDLNYEIVSQDQKRQVVHVNRLKKAHDPGIWNPKPTPKGPVKRQDRPKTQVSELSEDNVQIGPRPLLETVRRQERVEPTTPPTVVPDTPDSAQSVDTPYAERMDPSYQPPQTPRSRREIQVERTEPPLTRARSRIQAQDTVVIEAQQDESREIRYTGCRRRVYTRSE
jgi:transposase InsO family protein